MEYSRDVEALDSRLDEALDETFPASDPVAVHLPEVAASKSFVRVHRAHRDDIGNLTTRRPLPGPQLDRVGAFLFLNHHGPQDFPPGNEGLPFGPHPHRGFETVTFIVQGVLAHRDTAGHESVIHAGGVQWMTAGSGLIHEEISPASFKRDGGPLEILQLWVNLPARLKNTPPRYIGLQRDAIPAIRADNDRVTINLIAGIFGEREGPVHSLTGVFMATVETGAGGRVSFDRLAGRDVFLYVVRGAISVAGTAVQAFDLAEVGEGNVIEIEAASQAMFLFGHADPIDDPVVSHGPFVMNTVDEIRQAYADYRAGRFQVPAAG
ncbi:MAG TPA: pirin family protein [Steroidobacteraceae bacterium]|jgi:redox-sensitive bicupin YhaK (pirin superfamily)|nr:pirin family protein [Steroidobacteraceae bacterium]